MLVPRAIWSGSITFGLVNAPVRMYSAIDEHNLELHLVHEKDGSRIGYEKVCKREGKKVPSDEIVKAYEPRKGKLVYLTDKDFEAAEQDAYRTIEVLDFVPHDEIDPPSSSSARSIWDRPMARRRSTRSWSRPWSARGCRRSRGTCSTTSNSSGRCAFGTA